MFSGAHSGSPIGSGGSQRGTGFPSRRSENGASRTVESALCTSKPHVPEHARGLTTSYIRVYTVSESVRISEECHEFIAAHTREDETMEETLRRLIGGPHPEEVAGILSSETADAMRRRLEEKEEADVDGKGALRERFQ